MSIQRALVIGAGSDVGQATAGALTAAGIEVVAAGRERDATDPAQVGALLAEADPDLIVVAAGTRQRMASIEEQSWESFSEPWNVDVKIAFEVGRAALARPTSMSKLDRGDRVQRRRESTRTALCSRAGTRVPSGCRAPRRPMYQRIRIARQRKPKGMVRSTAGWTRLRASPTPSWPLASANAVSIAQRSAWRLMIWAGMSLWSVQSTARMGQSSLWGSRAITTRMFWSLRTLNRRRRRW